MDAPLVLTLGSLGHDKGTLHLLEAAGHLWRRDLPLELALVGTMLPELRRRIRRLPKAHRAHCHVVGRVSEPEKWDALAAADVVALPSRTESFGLVFLEAWLLAKPVIGARAGALPDVVRDGTDGLLVKFGDVSALAEALAHLTSQPAAAAEMGLRGQARVLRDYTWAHQYYRVAAVVRTVMAQSRANGVER